MGLFDKLFKRKKDPSSPAYKWEMAKRICYHHIRYVTEKQADGTDIVIGREGALNIKEDQLLVFASADVIFRCRVEEMEAWDLLSGDGVVITAPDLENGGRVRTIVVFYVNY